jgi:hypothetical protein
MGVLRPSDIIPPCPFGAPGLLSLKETFIFVDTGLQEPSMPMIEINSSRKM